MLPGAVFTSAVLHPVGENGASAARGDISCPRRHALSARLSPVRTTFARAEISGGGPVTCAARGQICLGRVARVLRKVGPQSADNTSDALGANPDALGSTQNTPDPHPRSASSALGHRGRCFLGSGGRGGQTRGSAEIPQSPEGPADRQ